MFDGAVSEEIKMEEGPNRVRTGIPGFDELCGGGLIRDRTYLVSGTSGAGKTNFSIQFIYNGITKYGENGVIVATEERPEQIRENVLKFGWDLENLKREQTCHNRCLFYKNWDTISRKIRRYPTF